MIDTDDTEEFSSQDEIPYMSSQLEEQSVVAIEIFLLRQFTSPFRVAWILMKLGYEPLPPVRFHSPLALLGWTSPAYVYPNIFKYVYHLMKTVGVWTVLTTGLFGSASQDFIGEIFRGAFRRRTLLWTQTESKGLGHNMRTRNSPKMIGTFHTERLLEESNNRLFVERLAEVLSLSVWEVLISHPFYVITVRQIAALIGKEPNYAWFPSAVHTIYRENGIMGFFQGLVPRLIGELIMTSAYYCCCRVVRRLVFGVKHNSRETMGVLRVFLYFSLRNYTYPFELVGCIMSLHGARIVGAAESNSFRSWRDCKRYLTLNDQTSRGWLPFLRSHVQKKHIVD